MDTNFTSPLLLRVGSSDQNEEETRLRHPNVASESQINSGDTNSYTYVGEVDTTPDDDFREYEPLSKIKIITLNLSYFGLNLMFLLLSVELIPAQIEAMVGPKMKGTVLGTMIAGGAVITVLAGPFIGMQSDRSTLKYGKRRPIMVIALIIMCFGLIGMALSAQEILVYESPDGSNSSQICEVDLEMRRCAPYNSSDNSHTNPFGESTSIKGAPFKTNGYLGLYVPFYLIVITAYICIVTPYNALIADKSVPEHRGLNSGVMGGMILLGNIFGAILGIAITKLGVVSVYGIAMGILVLCLAVTVISIPETQGRHVHTPLTCRDIVIGYWSPLKGSDFRWVFITRFLMQQGVSTIVGFLQFWLTDMIPLPYCWSPTKSLAFILLPLLVLAAVSSVISGFVSDRLNKRKSLVIVASIIMAAMSIIMASLRGPNSYFVTIGMSMLFGFSFGGYQAVDFALLMDVLPAEKDKSRDISVWHQALILPQALAIPVGGVILDLFERVNCHVGLGYIIIFSLSALYFLLSGIFVTKVKNAR